MEATGAGKTYLSFAFGITAWRQFHKAHYVRLLEHLDEFKITKNRSDESYKKLILEKLAWASFSKDYHVIVNYSSFIILKKLTISQVINFAK